MNRMNFLYKESDSFEKERRSLLSDVVRYIDIDILRKGFIRDFKKFFDKITLDMMIAEEDFYALFLSKMTFDVNFQLNWPLSTIFSNNDIILEVNPISFLYLNKKEMEAMIKHEVFHILLNHHSRERVLKRKYSSAAVNIALDITVNQFISNVPAFSLKLSSVNRALDLNLELNETLEKYTEIIDKALVYDKALVGKIKNETGFDYNNVHDEWGKGKDLSNDISKEKLATTLEYSMKSNVPNEILKLMPNTEKSKINWKKEIRDAIKSMPSLKRKTMARRNRRQPERLDLRGELRQYSPKIIVAIDVSASIDNSDIKDFLIEILPLMKEQRQGIRVIECDNQIRKDYLVNDFTDIKDISDRTGGTMFSPVFELLRDEGDRNSLVVYFTDGEGESKLRVKPINDIIWVVNSEKLSINNPPGRILYIEKEKEIIDRALGLQTMRELLHEWAR